MHNWFLWLIRVMRSLNLDLFQINMKRYLAGANPNGQQ